MLRGCAFIAGDVREFSLRFGLGISFASDVFPKISSEAIKRDTNASKVFMH